MAGHHRGDAQGEALLPQQRVAAIARAVGPDLPRLGKMRDVLAVRITGPRHVRPASASGIPPSGSTARMAVRPSVERSLPHPGHDPHRRRHVGRVGQLHADVRDRASRAVPSRTGPRTSCGPASTPRTAARAPTASSRGPPVIGRARILLPPRTNERALLHPGHVRRIRPRQIRVGAPTLVERLERSGPHQPVAQPPVLLHRTVTPVHPIGPGQGRHLLHPSPQPGVRSRSRGAQQSGHSLRRVAARGAPRRSVGTTAEPASGHRATRPTRRRRSTTAHHHASSTSNRKHSDSRSGHNDQPPVAGTQQSSMLTVPAWRRGYPRALVARQRWPDSTTSQEPVPTNNAGLVMTEAPSSTCVLRVQQRSRSRAGRRLTAPWLRYSSAGRGSLARSSSGSIAPACQASNQ